MTGRRMSDCDRAGAFQNAGERLSNRCRERPIYQARQRSSLPDDFLGNGIAVHSGDWPKEVFCRPHIFANGGMHPVARREAEKTVLPVAGLAIARFVEHNS